MWTATGRFVVTWARPSHRDCWRDKPHPQEWLPIEWPEEKEEPTSDGLSSVAAPTAKLPPCPEHPDRVSRPRRLRHVRGRRPVQALL